MPISLSTYDMMPDMRNIPFLSNDMHVSHYRVVDKCVYNGRFNICSVILSVIAKISENADRIHEKNFKSYYLSVHMYIYVQSLLLRALEHEKNDITQMFIVIELLYYLFL